MKPKTFEDYLQEHYLGHEDEGRSHNGSSAADNFERWLENVQIDQLIELGNEAVHKSYLAGLDRAIAIIK